MNQITIGSKVRLKSGGPDMTVKSYGLKLEAGPIFAKNVEDKDVVDCQWFNNLGELKESSFPILSLELV